MKVDTFYLAVSPFILQRKQQANIHCVSIIALCKWIFSFG